MGYSVFMTEQITADVARAFQSGDMAQVVALVENLPARARDSNETALLAYGLALHSLRRNREAAAALRQLVQLKPDVPEYWNNLGITAQQACAKAYAVVDRIELPGMQVRRDIGARR